MRSWSQPKWSLPPGVRAIQSTRVGGQSRAPYTAFNLATHVGDDEACVHANRRVLASETGVATWCWLEQVHGTHIVDGQEWTPGTKADGCFSKQKKQACVVMTADCMPLLFCDRSGTQVAACHAGWRGMAGGIIEQTLSVFGDDASQVLAYLGPSIRKHHFEVGEDVRTAFLTGYADKLGGQTENFFEPLRQKGKYLADLVLIAETILQHCGVGVCVVEDACTWRDNARYYSYRKEGTTGRHASAIWLD